MNIPTAVLAVAVSWAAADAELQVLKQPDGTPAPSEMLYAYLAQQAQAAWDRRLEQYG
jgi:hypothetical protein